MTEEEAFELDKFVTEHPPKADPKKARPITRMVALDALSAEYLFSVALSMHKTPSEVIAEMVREKMSVQPVTP
jgi:hypothetical protein